LKFVDLDRAEATMNTPISRIPGAHADRAKPDASRSCGSTAAALNRPTWRGDSGADSTEEPAGTLNKRINAARRVWDALAKNEMVKDELTSFEGSRRERSAPVHRRDALRRAEADRQIRESLR
jgi:hypothetical protein